MPMPRRKTNDEPRKGRKLPFTSAATRTAMLPTPQSINAICIDRSSPIRSRIRFPIRPAAKTTRTVPAKKKPTSIGRNAISSIITRGAAENIENSPPMIKATVVAGTMKRRSRNSCRYPPPMNPM